MDCELLISEVFSRKQLWDISHPQHHNRGILDKMWAEISETMHVSVEEVRQKWKYLRDQFRKELRKRPVKHSGDEGGPSYEPTWPYYHLLLFLKDQFTPTDMSGNISSGSSQLINANIDIEDYEEDGESVRQIETQSQSSVHSSNMETTMQPIKSSTIKRHSRSSFGTHVINVKLLKLEETKIDLLKEQQEKCDDYYFFMSLIPAMKKFTDMQKFKIRTKFQQIIMDEMSNSLYMSSGSTTPMSHNESRPISAQPCEPSYQNLSHSMPLSPINLQSEMSSRSTTPMSHNESGPMSAQPCEPSYQNLRHSMPLSPQNLQSDMSSRSTKLMSHNQSRPMLAQPSESSYQTPGHFMPLSKQNLRSDLGFNPPSSAIQYDMNNM